MNRRRFIYKSSGLMAAGMLISLAPTRLMANAFTYPHLCQVKTNDPYRAVFKAVSELGGIRRFVPQGSKVGFLINSAFEEPGTYPHPDIALAMLFLCWEAGAGEITMLQPVAMDYWRRSSNFDRHRFIIQGLHQVESNSFPAVYNDTDFRIKETIAGAAVLKDIEIIKKIDEVDVFISIPILKHHATTILTGAMKNMMGLTTRKTNVNFHLGSGKRNDPEYLAQCITELNLVRKPDLIVADAIEFITGNGPSGPGPLKKMDVIVAGTDPVAIDAYGARCLDMAPEDILSVVMGDEYGLGEMELDRLQISEISI